MVHTAPPSYRRRRLETLIGALVVLAGLALVAVTIVALNHPKGRQAGQAAAIPTSSSAKPSASKSKSSPGASTPAPSRSAVSTPTTSRPVTSPNSNHPAVVVLNNTNDSGLTATAISRFQQGGWTATDGGGFDGSILSTAAYYDPSVAGAQAAADQLQAQFPAIKRVKERFTGLPEGSIIVVLTTDYS